jgi:hypothetical protein
MEYLNNNFIMAGCVSTVATIGLVAINRKNEETIQYKTYLKHLVLIYVLVLALLYFKKINGSPLIQKGGGAPTINGYQQEINIGEPNF